MNNLGVIYDISDEKAIVLSEEGFFVPVSKRDNMYIGQLIKYNSNEIIPQKTNRFKLLYGVTGIAAVFALIISLFLIKSTFEVKPAFGFVCVDINPSAELTINKDYKVTNITFFNDDAKRLFNNQKFKGESLSAAISLMIDASKGAGIISDSGSAVFISTAINDENLSDKDNENDILDEFVDFIDKDIKDISQKKDCKVEMAVIPMEERKVALENNMSMGRYFLYDKAIKQGLNIHINDFKTSKISDIFYILEDQNPSGVNASIGTKPIIAADGSSANTDVPSVTDPKDSSKVNIGPTEVVEKPEVNILATTEQTNTVPPRKLSATPTVKGNLSLTTVPKVNQTVTQAQQKVERPSNVNNVKVIFYEHIFYNTDNKGFEVRLPIGRYTVAKLNSSGIKNDKVSSIKIPDGLEVVIYEDDNFKGKFHILNKSISSLFAIGANDKTSSVVIRKKK